MLDFIFQSRFQQQYSFCIPSTDFKDINPKKLRNATLILEQHSVEYP
jgi:hypothetical protein